MLGLIYRVVVIPLTALATRQPVQSVSVACPGRILQQRLVDNQRRGWHDQNLRVQFYGLPGQGAARQQGQDRRGRAGGDMGYGALHLHSNFSSTAFGEYCSCFTG